MIRPIYFVMGKQCSVTEDWETVMAAMAADATYHQITFGDYQPICPDDSPMAPHASAVTNRASGRRRLVRHAIGGGTVLRASGGMH